MATRQAELAGSPATEAAGMKQRTRDELRAVSAELSDGLHRLADAEAEHLMLAEERLSLLQSRVELSTIREQNGFEQNPQVVAVVSLCVL